ncbi:MAG: hypothetical protein ACREWG_06500 [Gammaproteobacteria bacterium]
MKTQCGDVTRKYGVLAGVLTAAVASLPLSAQAGGSNRLLDLEQQVQQLQQQLDELRTETTQKAQEAAACCAENSEHIRRLDERVTSIETVPTKWSTRNKNMVFFRGGFADYVDNARGFESFTDVHDVDGTGQLLGFPRQDAEGAWYVGAAIEHSISDDLWGLLPTAEVLGEIGLEYKNFGSERAVLVVPAAECSLLTGAVAFDALDGIVTDPGGPVDGGCLVTGDVALTMFTVSAAPKIKFLQGHPWKIRPWIIPVGLDFHVISPPTDGATYLDVGAQFAAGVEYEIIPGIKFGIDGRYHYTADISSTDNNMVAVTNRELRELPPGDPRRGIRLTGDTENDYDFWTVGGYLGFTF